MILIQKDVWRAECIAALGTDEALCVQVYPLNCSDPVEYEWDNAAQAAQAYREILQAWRSALGV